MARNNGQLNDQNNLPHATYKVFNDSVHGHIKLHELCTKIVDTVEFQRLRRIKQLGVTDFVFPAACHKRFEHSLGVCYLAGQLLEKLVENDKQWTEDNRLLTGKHCITEKEKLCVQIAGLCHDLGHGPFSHTWEHVVKKFDPQSNWKHEASSIDIFSKIAVKLKDEFNKFNIGEEEIKFIKVLIGGLRPEDEKHYPKEKYFLFEIIANKRCEIDVDKWDYLLRDGQLLNLNSTFDYRRLLEFCAVVRLKNGTYHIGFKKSEINSLYDIFRMRAEFHFKAYQHPVVKNIETMYIDAFVSAGEYKINGRIKLKEAHKTCDNLLRLTDHVYSYIIDDESETTKRARKIFLNIIKRKLYKLIGKWNLPESCFNNDVEEKTKIMELLKIQLPDYYRRANLQFIKINLGIFDESNDPTIPALYKKDNTNGERAILVEFNRNMLQYPIERSRSRQCQLLVFYDNTEEDDDDRTSTNIEEIKAVIDSYMNHRGSNK